MYIYNTLAHQKFTLIHFIHFMCFLGSEIFLNLILKTDCHMLMNCKGYVFFKSLV